MAIARIFAQGFGFGQDGGTTPNIDTTGCDFFWAAMEGQIGGSTPTITDNKSNIWHSLTLATGAGFTAAIIFWCVPTSVGAGHQFTFNPPVSAGAYPGCFISGYSGVDQTSPLDHDAGDPGNAGASSAWTPGVAGALVVGIIANFTGNVTSVASPLTLDVHQPLTGGTNYDGAISYVIQTTAVSVTVDYTATWGGRGSVAAASFKPAGGGGGITPINLTASDTLSLSDSLTKFLTATEITLSDALSLSDRLNIVLNLFPAGFSDSFSFSDALINLIGVGKALSDTLTLSDFLLSYIILARQFNDNLLLSDILNVLVANNPSYADQFTFSDVAKLELSLRFSFSEAFIFLDSIQVRLSNNLLLGLSDTLLLTDSIELVLSGDMDSYIRHYLNDVPN